MYGFTFSNLKLKKTKKFRKISYFIWVVKSCIMMVFILHKMYKYAKIILYAHIFIAFAVLAGKMSNRNKIKRKAG